jgi:hypothetical protein
MISASTDGGPLSIFPQISFLSNFPKSISFPFWAEVCTLYKIYILHLFSEQRQRLRLNHKRIPEAITFPFLVKNGAKRQNSRRNCSRSSKNLDQGISLQNNFRQVTTPSFSSTIEENLSKINSDFRLNTVDQEALFQFVQRQSLK